jgi:alpha-N-arabinofuranosidase
MRYRPENEGDEAGLTAFHDDDNFYAMGVTLSDGQPVIQLKQAEGGAPQVVVSSPLDLPDDSPIYLKIEAAGAKYGFYYALEPDQWIPLEEHADGKVLSTQVAGGFVGTYFGLYAHSDTE